MTLNKLKELISNKIVPSEFMIFVCKDSPFLASQYIQAINKLANGGITKVSSIYEPQQSSIALLTAFEDSVYVLNTETFDERAEDYSQFENVIVVCEQIDKSIAKDVEDYVVKFPKLEEWQILDYAKTICTGVDESDLLWFIRATNNDIEQILNELSKVAIFNKTEQPAIFASIRFGNQIGLYQVDLFTIVNALVDGELKVLHDFIKYEGYNDLEPVVLANRALTSLKNILLTSQNPNLDAASCGMSVSQFNFLKRKYQGLNVNACRQKVKFLTKFDLDLKTSKLELNRQEMCNYLVSNLSYKITL